MKLIATEFSSCDFYEKTKSNEDFLKKVLSAGLQMSMIGRICKFTNAYFVLFLSKMHFLVFLGASTTGIQNGYMLSKI